MKNILIVLGVLAGGMFLGWLIFGVGGRPGDMALGGVAGVCLVMLAGTYFVDRTKSEHIERRTR